MDRELLIEIGVEELPAAWLPGLTRQFGERLEARLKEHRIAPGRAGRDLQHAAASDRPLREDRRAAGGPRGGRDGAAGIGGVRSGRRTHTGGRRICEEARRDRRRISVARQDAAASTWPTSNASAARARSTRCPDVFGRVLRDLSFPKQMRWDATLDEGRSEFVFGRPIRWLLFLYGGRVVPFVIGRAPHASGPQVQEIGSGALTYGHRFLATSGRAGRSIKVRSFEEYDARLKEHFVVLDHAERRDRIARDLEGHARRLGGRVVLKEHHALVDEVADLVEYPAVVAGFFDRAFLALPQEVLATTLVHHQHYFPVVSEDGELKEAFLAVVNTQPKDERVIAKNAERVVTGRLRDARFFWESDRKSKLESRLDRLHTVLFHKKLGSYRDKTQRIEALASWIAQERFGAPAGRAACGNRGAPGEGRPHHRHGVRVSRAPGHDGRHLRAGRGASGGSVEGDLSPLPADRRRSGGAAVTRGARRGRRDLGGGFARRQARYRGRAAACR